MKDFGEVNDRGADGDRSRSGTLGDGARLRLGGDHRRGGGDSGVGGDTGCLRLYVAFLGSGSGSGRDWGDERLGRDGLRAGRNVGTTGLSGRNGLSVLRFGRLDVLRGGSLGSDRGLGGGLTDSLFTRLGLRGAAAGEGGAGAGDSCR